MLGDAARSGGPIRGAVRALSGLCVQRGVRGGAVDVVRVGSVRGRETALQLGDKGLDEGLVRALRVEDERAVARDDHLQRRSDAVRWGTRLMCKRALARANELKR